MLKINLGAESAAMLEKTRRAVNDLQSSVKRISSGIAIESAGDDPGAIGSVVFTETAISGIQRTLKNLNEGITITQALSSDLNLVEKLLLTLRDVAEQAASDQFTDTQRAELQADAQSILPRPLRASFAISHTRLWSSALSAVIESIRPTWWIQLGAISPSVFLYSLSHLL